MTSSTVKHPFEDEEMAVFSLTKAVEEVSHQGYANMAALQEKLDQLSSLQAVLHNADTRSEHSALELRAATRRTLILDEDLHQCQRRSEALWSSCSTANSHTSALRLRVDEERERARLALAGIDVHRVKMKEHRAAVALAESKRESHQALEEQRRRVRELREKREKQRRDLEDPNGRAVQEGKTGQVQLKQQLVALRKATAQKREELRQENDTHTQIRKEIKIQHRRYEAIVRRLHCQLNKAQAYYRHLSGDVNHMERQVLDLRRQLNSS
ncbi:unnamed protein product [Gadus morhua 'NCC']